MRFARLATGKNDIVRPFYIGSREFKFVLNDCPKKLLAANPNLTIDARHSTCRFVRGIHKGIVEAEPIVEGVTLIELLKLRQREAVTTGTLPELRSVMRANADRIDDDFQIARIFIGHTISSDSLKRIT
jgi:hypothetical protein